MTDLSNCSYRYAVDRDSYILQDGKHVVGEIAVDDLENHCPEWRSAEVRFGKLGDQIQDFWSKAHLYAAADVLVQHGIDSGEKYVALLAASSVSAGGVE